MHDYEFRLLSKSVYSLALPQHARLQEEDKDNDKDKMAD